MMSSCMMLFPCHGMQAVDSLDNTTLLMLLAHSRLIYFCLEHLFKPATLDDCYCISSLNMWLSGSSHSHSLLRHLC